MAGTPEPTRASAFAPIPDEWNDISRRVIACAIEVHTILGPGLPERACEKAMVHELRLAGLSFTRQQSIRLRYKGVELVEHRLDLVVEGLLIVELKATDRISDVHLAQLVSSRRSADLPLGLPINSNNALLKDGIYRPINPYSTAIRGLPKPRRPAPYPSVPSGPPVNSAFPSE